MQFSPDDLRLISVAQSVWLRMLAAREETILKRIVSEFHNGRTDFLALIAEFATVRGQTNEIQSALRQLENSKE